MTGFRFSARTHTGHVRKLNEDAILAMPDQRIWVVSDGMGGHDAGDYASRVVVDSIAMLPGDLADADKLAAVRGALHNAHAVISAEAARRDTTIGATVVAFLLAGDFFGALWAGDSRLYRMRAGAVEMLTHDHSLVASLVDAGRLTWDEAEHHPQSNAITRAVGVGEELELDKVRGETEPGDRFLICSDGLTKYAPRAVLERALWNRPVEVAADELVQLALDGGGADNISVIVIDIV